MLPEPIKRFVDAVAKLPGIGPRQATRLAFHLSNQGKADVMELAEAVQGLNALAVCATCFATTPNSDICAICSNPNRRQDLVAIVEKETDLISLEKAKKFDGRYLVLGELKKDGFLTNVQKLRLRTLENVQEAILAMNPTTYGDINASLIAQELKESVGRLTRLGRGIPTGGEIEFADEETLSSAIQNRS
ncbi:MAG: toprim domain-containing protein [bacterium]|nr:toprim domain-containing protein [bacterium]